MKIHREKVPNIIYMLLSITMANIVMYFSRWIFIGCFGFLTILKMLIKS